MQVTMLKRAFGFQDALQRLDFFERKNDVFVTRLLMLEIISFLQIKKKFESFSN